MCGSVMRANGFAVCITADADTAGGIWRGMDPGDGQVQGTAVDAQVQVAWPGGVALFRRQWCNYVWRTRIEKALYNYWLGNSTPAEFI